MDKLMNCNSYNDRIESLRSHNEKEENIVVESEKFAEESPFPEPEELYRDVYVQKDYPYITE